MKIMLVVQCFLAIFLVNSVFGLSCIDDYHIEMSLQNLTHHEFNKYTLNIKDFYSTEIHVCCILLSVDYANKMLSINVYSSMESLKDGINGLSVDLNTTFTRIPNGTLVTELLIRCSYKDLCDEELLFMENHERWWWLIDEVNHTSINQKFNQLFIKNGESTNATRCYNGGVIDRCNSQMCSVQNYSQYISPYRGCLTSATGETFLRIKTVIKPAGTASYLAHTIDYTCQFDECNSESIYKQALTFTIVYYKVSVVERVFNGKSTTISITALNSTRISPVSMSVTSNFASTSVNNYTSVALTTHPTISMMSIVIILLIYY